jgi:ubiquinone/menaquinone biosynthesis C-methylase UbiE
MERSDPGTETTVKAFTAQADAFEDPERNQVFTADARWVFDRLALRPDDLVLDVAAGTGHAARQLAPSVRAVVALDLTPAMLAAGQAAALREGLTNVIFMRAQAAALPFLDASFDVVVSRFAAHHFEDPAAVLAEMVRCTRQNGTVACVDLVAADAVEVAARQNELERLRDPSHARMLRAEDTEAMLAGAGLGVIDRTLRPLRRPLRPWLEQTNTAPEVAAAIEAALQDELAGGAVTGFRPEVLNGELWFVQTFGSWVATRPARPRPARPRPTRPRPARSQPL